MFKSPYFIFTSLIILLGEVSFAQFWKKPNEDAFKAPIVHVYPYKNGVQLIEIDYIQTWDSYTSYLDALHPRGSSYKVDIAAPHMNAYVFRNEQKQVFKAYNTHENLDSLTKRFYDFSVDSVSNNQQVFASFPGFYRGSSFNKKEQTQSYFLIYNINKIFDLEPYTSVEVASNKVGIIDDLGNELVPPTYAFIELFEHGFLARNESSFGLLNFQLDTLLPFGFTHYRFLPEKEEVLLFENERVTNVYRRSINAVFEVEFSDILPLSEGHHSNRTANKLRLAHLNYAYQIIDTTYAPINEEVYEFVEGHPQFNLIRVVKNKLWGLINKKGEEVIPCSYDDVWIVNQDSSIVKLEEKYHWLNHEGEVLGLCDQLPFQIKQRLHYNVFQRGAYFGINNGPLIYTHVRKINDSLYIVQRNNEKFGIVNEKGQLQSDSYYNSIHPINENRSFVTMNRAYIQKDGYFYSQSYFYQERYGAILNDFAQTIPCIYQQIDAVPHNGLILFKINDRYGYMDTTGRTIIPNQFKKAFSFNNGLALVGNDSLYGFIGTDGQVVIDIGYQSLGYLKYGMIMAKKEGKFGVIDCDEDILVPFKYEGLLVLSEDYLKVQQDGKWGMINSKAKVKIPFNYEWISEIIWDKYVQVKQNGKIGVQTLAGKEVFPCKFDRIVSWSANPNMNNYQIRVVDNKGTYWLDFPR